MAEGIYLPTGGVPEVPESGGRLGAGASGKPEPPIVDWGTWDGSGFWWSGVPFSDAYIQDTLRISTPGTYRYACLIHPPMVGTVTVTG